MQTFSSLLRGRYTRRMVALLSVAAVTAGFVVAARAQNPTPAVPLPDTPPHIVVGHAPGGATDRVARAAWEASNATMPPVPDDATASPGYSTKDMPRR